MGYILTKYFTNPWQRGSNFIVLTKSRNHLSFYLQINFLSERQSSMHPCRAFLTRSLFRTNPISWWWWTRSKLQLLLTELIKLEPWNTTSLGKVGVMGVFFFSFLVKLWGKLHSLTALLMHIFVAYIVNTGNWDGLRESEI